MVWTVRKGTLSDAPEVARVNVEGWRTAYRGILTDEYLDAIRSDDRLERLEERLTAREPSAVFVAVSDAGTVGAYGGVTPVRDAGDEHPVLPTGEFAALYADTASRGTGAGHAVHEAGLDHLAEQGFKHVILWVFEKNAPSRRFYEARGWACDEVTKDGVLGGARFTEIRYSRALN
ncbi:GNAT family N-acetyltransferase [Amycolatopsis sp.]|uniref:GNAT family N-acetyltransferase n=1 Tax=Amycolatopsis sp. TaxID=37632 RepID=UPI002E0271FD|nr:GNAT family N-acetyltransferase [Amycolatopsis sp.]